MISTRSRGWTPTRISTTRESRGLDRERKDAYLFYSALLSDGPYLAIGNREWKSRGGMTCSGTGLCVQTVPVFTNAASVEMSVNGRSLGSVPVEGSCAFFDVPFADGANVLEAVASFSDGRQVRDMLRVDFQGVPEKPGKDFRPDERDARI